MRKRMNFGNDDNYGDTQNIDGIDREAVFQAGMSIAHEIFGDKTDEKIVDSMVDSAIDKALAQDGDTQVAIGILKGMFTSKNFGKDSKMSFSKIVNKIRTKKNFSSSSAKMDRVIYRLQTAFEAASELLNDYTGDKIDFSKMILEFLSDTIDADLDSNKIDKIINLIFK